MDHLVDQPQLFVSGARIAIPDRKSLIAAGFGVSLVTESDIGANFSGLTYRELRDGTGPSRVGFSAHWRSDNDNPALANFLKLFGKRYPLPVERA